MSEIVMVVDVQAAPGHVQEVIDAFEACSVKTHEEEGCIAYALHVDAADPDHLLLVERWASQEALDAHMTQPYVADLFAVARTPGVLATAPVLTASVPLGLGDPTKGTLAGASGA